MTKPLVPDELWEMIEPILPPDPPRPGAGRPRLSDRAVLTGIIFILKTGIPWNQLPTEMGYGSGMTCWRRLRDWKASGVWPQIQRVLSEHLADADQIDWLRPSLEAAVLSPGRAQRIRRMRHIAAMREQHSVL